MDEEILKKKYQTLGYNVNVIKSKISNTLSKYENMISNLGENVKIDDQLPKADMLDSVKTDINNISYEISNNLLPKINNKSF